MTYTRLSTQKGFYADLLNYTNAIGHLISESWWKELRASAGVNYLRPPELTWTVPRGQHAYAYAMLNIGNIQENYWYQFSLINHPSQIGHFINQPCKCCLHLRTYCKGQINHIVRCGACASRGCHNEWWFARISRASTTPTKNCAKGGLHSKGLMP